MIRTLLGLLAIAALAVAGAAQAAPYAPAKSSLSFRFGWWPPLTVAGNVDGVSGSIGAGGTLTMQPEAFGPLTTALPSSLFTGVPTISGLSVSSMSLHGANATRTFDASPPVTNAVGADFVGNFGGTAPLSGTATIESFQVVRDFFPLSAVGAGGTTTISFGSSPIQMIAGGGWTAGPAQVTKLTHRGGGGLDLVRTQGGATGVLTTLPVQALQTAVTITTGGLTVNDPNATGEEATTTAVTLTGFDARTANGAGTVQLVTPIMVRTNDIYGRPTPAFGSLTLTFVPEPATLLLSGAGLAGLAILRRRRRHA